MRANVGPFMTKALQKATMYRKKLRNRYIKSRTEENLKAFKKQRNSCVKLLRRTKSDYYRNLDHEDLTDDRKFWKTVKPVFSNEIKTNSAVTLIEDGKMITEGLTIFNRYFTNITESLGISEDQTLLSPLMGSMIQWKKLSKNMKIIPSLKRSKNASN